MSDDDGPVDDGERGDGTSSRSPRSTSRRHLIVLGCAVIGLVVGVTLVVTGRDAPEQTPPASTVTVDRGPLLRSLGAVADEKAARTLLGDLDPDTLRPSSSVTSAPGDTTNPGGVDGIDLTESGLQRCQQAIAQQNTDRSLGSRLAAARLQVARNPAFVVSYELPASGSDPAGGRIVLVDARTCRVLGAVDR